MALVVSASGPTPPPLDAPRQVFDATALADLMPLPAWVNSNATSNWVNRAMIEFTGRTAEQHAGHGWLDVVHPDDRDGYVALSMTAAELREPYEATYRLRRADGAWRHVVNRAAPHLLDDGNYVYLGVCTDITEQVESLAGVERDRQKFEFLVAVLSELVDATTDQLPARLSAVVEHIGRFADVDRVGLVRIDHERDTMELEHAWHSARIRPDYRVRRSIPMSEQPALGERLRRLEIVYIDDVAAMNDDDVDREMLRGRGIHSNAEVPIVLGGELTGLLFLDDHHAPRQWEGSLPMLRLVGHALAGALGRQQADAVQRRSERRFKSLFDANPLPMFVLDPTTMHISQANAAAHAVYAVGDGCAASFAELHPDQERARIRAMAGEAEDAIRRSGPWRHRVASGDEIRVELSASATNLDGRDALLVVVHDVTGQHELERQLRHQAYHDNLTGLPNRALLGERLERAVVAHAGGVGELAVILLDLDGFKTVNDSLGHQAGDRLLVQAGERLRTTVRDADTLARLGGDEFAIVIEATDALGAARGLAGRLAAALAAPFPLDGRDVTVSASFGIAVASASDTASSLLRNADLAMFAAKDGGRGRTVEFTDDLETKARDHLELLSDLRRALNDGELVLHYQPTTDLATSTVTGVEALIRWQHPEHGLLGPGRFLPVIEDTPFITRVGGWVLDEACRQHRAWTDDLGWSPTMAVNVAPRQLTEPDFVGTVAAALARHAMPADQLVIEITERSLLDDDDTLERLRALRGLGVRIAIDDFGTGYSSLSYLRRLPVDVLKVDQSFVAALDAENEQTLAVVTMIIGLAEVLGLETIAEGIETEAQLALLGQIGCTTGQGYHLARPAAVATITELLRAERPSAVPR